MKENKPNCRTWTKVKDEAKLEIPKSIILSFVQISYAITTFCYFDESTYNKAVLSTLANELNSTAFLQFKTKIDLDSTAS